MATAARLRRWSVPRATLEALAGRYEVRETVMATFMPGEGGLDRYTDGRPDELFVPTAPLTFVREDGAVTLRFSYPPGRSAPTVTLTDGEGTRAAWPRVGRPVARLAGGTDPSPDRTARLVALVDRMERGATDSLDAALADGARWAYAGRRTRSLQTLGRLRWMANETLDHAAVVRDGHAVASVTYFATERQGRPMHLMMLLTADGRVADFDLIEH